MTQKATLLLLLAGTILFSLTLHAQQEAEAPEEPGAVSGIVTDATTGAPLAKAAVTLQGVRGRDRQRFMATSGSAGLYRIENVTPGEYRLSADRNLYSTSAYGSKGPGRPGAAVTVGAAADLQEMNIQLTPSAVVTGRVTDGDGEPAAYVQVMALVYRYANGQRQLTPSRGIVMTDDRGEYRIFGLAPGRYHFMATSASRGRGGNASDDTEAHPNVFYPGTTDASQAQTIRLQAGEERNGVDFRLVSRPGARVKGKVTGDEGLQQERVSVFLAPRQQTQLPGMFSTSARVDPRTGKFDIKGVLPGSYDLRAMIRGRSPLYASMPLEIGPEAVEEVILTLAPGANVTGSVRFDAEMTGYTEYEGMRVELRGEQQWGASGRSNVDQSTFKLQNLAPGTYTLRVSGLPDNAYLKSASVANQDVLLSGVLVDQGGLDGLNVEIGVNAGTVSGVVTTTAGEPLPGATAVLVPAPDKRTREDLFKSAVTDQNGSFTLGGVAPGEYKLLAFEYVESGAYHDPDFLEQYEDDAREIEIDEGGRQVLEVKALPDVDS